MFREVLQLSRMKRKSDIFRITQCWCLDASWKYSRKVTCLLNGGKWKVMCLLKGPSLKLHPPSKIETRPPQPCFNLSHVSSAARGHNARLQRNFNLRTNAARPEYLISICSLLCANKRHCNRFHASHPLRFASFNVSCSSRDCQLMNVHRGQVANAVMNSNRFPSIRSHRKAEIRQALRHFHPNCHFS